MLRCELVNYCNAEIATFTSHALLCSDMYPDGIERNSLDEELWDINQARNALSRLERSPSAKVDIDFDQVEDALQSEADRLQDIREGNVVTNSCREALYEFCEDQDINYEDGADRIEVILQGDSVSEKMDLVLLVKDALPREYEYTFDEDALLTKLGSFVESGDF